MEKERDMSTQIEFCESVIESSRFITETVNLEHGAQDIFIGKVRQHNQNRDVVGIEYEIFEDLARQVLSELCSEARTKIDPNLDFSIVHRSGYLHVGETSVLIIASSKHRDEAFRACRFIIEEIKHRVPIWKQEHYTDGKSEWVQGHALCQHN